MDHCFQNRQFIKTAGIIRLISGAFKAGIRIFKLRYFPWHVCTHDREHKRAVNILLRGASLSIMENSNFIYAAGRGRFWVLLSEG